MSTTVSRVLLGVLAALAVIGGAALVVMVVIYFGASEYVPWLSHYGGWGTLAGMFALAIYVAGAFRGTRAARIGIGLGLAGGTYVVGNILAVLVSLLGDPGGEQGNLQDGAFGFIWLVVGVYCAWRLVLGRWPVDQHAVSEVER